MIKKLGTLDEATISIALEDTICFDSPFLGRFGMCMLLELKAGGVEKHILYDTNSEAGPIFRNLEVLGKSLDEVSTIYLSHCHYDHTDGLVGVLEAFDRPIPVIGHSEIFRPCFEIDPDGIRHIGMAHPREHYESKGAQFTLAANPLNLMTGVTTSGEIERVTPFEILEDLYTIIDGEVVQDHERDDGSIILSFEEGLVIVTGCCHAGIVNTMMTAKKVTGIDKIHAVVGGLHFLDASEEKIEKSIEALDEVDWIFAGHCTGFDGLRRLANRHGDRFGHIQTGSMITFPIQDPKHPIDVISTSTRDRYRTYEV